MTDGKPANEEQEHENQITNNEHRPVRFGARGGTSYPTPLGFDPREI